jgi:hypothetical protein
MRSITSAAAASAVATFVVGLLALRAVLSLLAALSALVNRKFGLPDIYQALATSIKGSGVVSWTIRMLNRIYRLGLTWIRSWGLYRYIRTRYPQLLSLNWTVPTGAAAGLLIGRWFWR